MATKSLIIRPTSSSDVASNSSGISYQPSDTTLENAYLLLNEITADDDSTYIMSPGGLAVIYIGFIKPQMTNFERIKLHCRVYTEGAATAFTTTLRVIPVTESGFETIDITKNPNDTFVGQWADYIIDFSDEPGVVEALNDNQYTEIEIMWGGGSSGGSGSKITYNLAKLTQMYIELIYDDGEVVVTPLFYIRENDAWTNIEGTIY